MQHFQHRKQPDFIRHTIDSLPCSFGLFLLKSRWNMIVEKLEKLVIKRKCLPTELQKKEVILRNHKRNYTGQLCSGAA
jgi:hypothetical protein